MKMFEWKEGNEPRQAAPDMQPDMQLQSNIDENDDLSIPSESADLNENYLDN